jgi:hypothetical protein
MASRFRWKRLARRAWPVLLPSLLGLAGAAGMVNVRAQGSGAVQVAQLPAAGESGQWKRPEPGTTNPPDPGTAGPGGVNGGRPGATPPAPLPPPKPDMRRPSDPPPRNPGQTQPVPPIPAPQVPHKTDLRQ